jgi:hypothetical protein
LVFSFLLIGMGTYRKERRERGGERKGERRRE